MAWMIAYLALTAFSIGWPEYLNKVGSKYNRQLNSIVREVYNKMQKNNTFYENIVNAYNDKKNEVMTSIMMSNGFGTRIERLKQAMAENGQRFQDNKKKFDDKAADLNSKLHDVQDLINRTGTIAGNKNAESYLKDNTNRTNEKITSVVSTVNQAVNGGLSSETK